MKTENKVTF